jgi:hypothetical protein
VSEQNLRAGELMRAARLYAGLSPKDLVAKMCPRIKPETWVFGVVLKGLRNAEDGIFVSDARLWVNETLEHCGLKETP